jgi:hypothetical protein
VTEAPNSPVARLRASYQARQQADPDRFVDVWDAGELVAKIGRSEDMDAARTVMRTMSVMIRPELAEQIEITPDDLADVLAATTMSLHVRNGNGLEPLLIGDGQPVRFDHTYGQAIEVPEITTPRGAVFAAFTSPVVDDGPPELDTLKLMAVVSRVCATLATGRDVAQEVVGKASATSSGATPP